MANGVADEICLDLNEIEDQVRRVVTELLAAAKLENKDILVVGCSSSEIASRSIGTFSSKEIGECIFNTIQKTAEEKGVFVAAQCCEHLNRALIVESACAGYYGFTRVNVVPQLKAGGSFATAAYSFMKEAYAVESIESRAAAGIDIGDTLIGMHLRQVAVPVRVADDRIGAAHVVCARTRAKYVGGERAVYDPELG